MASRIGIFIFTKDRPETLTKTLASIQALSYSKYVIDDSVKGENQKRVIELCNSHSNCNYLGKEAFSEFTQRHKIDLFKYDFLVRTPGSPEWNLGYARNFALLYSKSLCLEKVLFSDDDIQVPDLDLIEKLFQLIKNYQFVGAHITGLVDDSVLGHIATDIGIRNERMLSGGFMVFAPFNIDDFFLNNYNEDWIWLFLQLVNRKYLQIGEVYQEVTNPLINYKNKIIFQEYGEIALDGLLHLYPSGTFEDLASLEFWQKMIAERKEYLNSLIAISLEKKEKSYAEIIEYVKANSNDLTATIFSNLFKKYFSDRALFQHLYKSISEA